MLGKAGKQPALGRSPAIPQDSPTLGCHIPLGEQPQLGDLLPCACPRLATGALWDPLWGTHFRETHVDISGQGVDVAVCMLGIKCGFHYLKSKLEAGESGHACRSMEDLVII